MQINRILVPIDFSEFSDKAVEYALYLAENFDADITLLHTVVLFKEEPDEEFKLAGYEKHVEKKERERQELFQPHHERAIQKGMQIDSEIIRGFSAADSIIDYINTHSFDLVVLGTHGRTGFKKWLYGSVAEKVVRLSPIPVLTTHDTTRQVEFDKILIPIDFSEFSKKAVKSGLEMFRKSKAETHFLHVVEQQIHPAFYAASFDSIFDIDKSLKERVLKNLMDFVGVPENKAKYAVTDGKAHKEIIKYAQNKDIDLIVMATRGLSKLQHFLVGSNAERVVCIAPCPVLTVGRE
jgi:nucleotide-binding universal stress UspA family protein